MADFDSVTGDFKGNPTITILDDEGQRVTTFGLKKARAIIDRIEDIKTFAKVNTPLTKKVVKKRETIDELEQTEDDEISVD